MLNQKPVFFSKNFFLFYHCFIVLRLRGPTKTARRPQGPHPPKILKATPENQTRNFKAKEIRIDFDEYFKLTNQYQEISH
jgi:hypothetical protein